MGGWSLRTGIEGIVRQMSALDEDCIALRDLDSVTAGVDGSLRRWNARDGQPLSSRDEPLAGAAGFRHGSLSHDGR